MARPSASDNLDRDTGRSSDGWTSASASAAIQLQFGSGCDPAAIRIATLAGLLMVGPPLQAGCDPPAIRIGLRSSCNSDLDTGRSSNASESFSLMAGLSASDNPGRDTSGGGDGNGVGISMPGNSATLHGANVSP